MIRYILLPPKIITDENMKSKYIRIMVTQEQKDFIQKTAKKEMRTMTALINKCIYNQYKDYPID